MAEVNVVGTQKSIDEALVRDAREPGYNLGIAASELGKPCARQIYYNWRWLHELEKPEPKMLRIFKRGEEYEEILLDELEAAEGVELQRFDERGRQIKIALVGGHVRGKLDGRAIGLPEAPKSTHTVECKSHNDKSFKDLVKRGVKKSKPEHFCQTMLYMHSMGDKRGLYMAGNKNDEARWNERLEYDVEYCIRMEAKAEMIIKSDQPPPKLHETPDLPGNMDCRFCKHKAICHLDAIPKTHNCRSCVYAKPIMDGKASWECSFHAKLLTYDEQRSGCDAHLFNPELIPGEVVEFNEEDHKVTYKLRNGKEFVDGNQVKMVKWFYSPDLDSVSHEGGDGEWFSVTEAEAKNLLATGSKMLDEG